MPLGWPPFTWSWREASSCLLLCSLLSWTLVHCVWMLCSCSRTLEAGSGKAQGGSPLPKACCRPWCARFGPTPRTLSQPPGAGCAGRERGAGAAQTGLDSLVRSKVLAQGQLLPACLQSFCSMAKDAQQPPKLLVLLQQALGLPDIFLGVQRWGVMVVGFRAPSSGGEVALQPRIPGSLPRGCPVPGRPRGWHRRQ